MKKKAQSIIALRRYDDGSYSIIDTRQGGSLAVHQRDDESERDFIGRVIQTLADHMTNVDLTRYDALDIPDDLAEVMGEKL